MIHKIVKREKYLIEYCKDKNVLHIGCCDSPFCIERYKKGKLLHTELINSAKKVIGIDVDSASLEYLKNKGINNLYEINVEKIKENNIAVLYDEKIDIILAGEILEHLNNPGLFLEGIKRLAKENVELIITVPNSPTLKSFLRSLVGTEMVHHDHVCYYSLKTLTTLLKRYSFEVKEYYYYTAPPVPERGLTMKISNKAAEYFCKLCPSLGDGLIAICRST